MYPVSEAFLQAVQGNTRKYHWSGKITTAAVRGKVILQPHGKEFFTWYSKHLFTLHGKHFFT